MVIAEEEKSLEGTFGKGLKRLRKQKGMKIEALAELAGYKNHTNIVKIEGGKTLPSLGKAFMLARILGVPIEAFVAEDYRAEGLDNTYRLTMESSKENLEQIIRFFRTIADDLERTLENNATQRRLIVALSHPFDPPVVFSLKRR